MKKDYKEQMVVKEWLVLALVKLMQDHPYKDITITQIADTAGVPRKTYYRNYSTKDDILKDYSDYLSQTFSLMLKNINTLDCQKFLCAVFEQCKEHLDYYRALIKNDNILIVLNCINHNMEAIAENTDDIYAYKCYAGGIYNVIFSWISKGCIEPYEEIVDHLLMFTNKDFVEKIISSYMKYFNKLED